MRVEIKSADVREVKGDSSKTGKPYHIREQRGWVDLGRAYPLEVTINLQKSQSAFAPGWYEAGDECWWLARGGKLQFDLSRMKPATQAASVRRTA